MTDFTFSLIFGAVVYMTRNTTKTRSNGRMLLTRFHSVWNCWSRQITPHMRLPICAPNTMSTKVSMTDRASITVNTMDRSFATMKFLLSSMSYATLNAFIRAVMPFEADHRVTIRPTESRPPLDDVMTS